MRRPNLVAALAVTALLAGCTGDAATSESTTDAVVSPTDGDRDPTEPGDTATPNTDVSAGGTPPPTSTDDADDGGAPVATSRPDGSATSSPGGALESVDAEQVCTQLDGPSVAEALRVDTVTAHPRTSETPQCAYAFEGRDGMQTNATVAVLRPDEDLGGRTGAEAFDHVVETNRQAAQAGGVTETAVSVGDQALLLSSENLHFGVVQFGRRIVTTIVDVRVADVAAAVDLMRATDVLAP